MIYPDEHIGETNIHRVFSVSVLGLLVAAAAVLVPVRRRGRGAGFEDRCSA